VFVETVSVPVSVVLPAANVVMPDAAPANVIAPVLAIDILLALVLAIVNTPVACSCTKPPAVDSLDAPAESVPSKFGFRVVMGIIRPLVLVYCLWQATLSILGSLCWLDQKEYKLHQINELLLALVFPYDQDIIYTFYNSAEIEMNPAFADVIIATGVNVVPPGEKFKPNEAESRPAVCPLIEVGPEL